MDVILELPWTWLTWVVIRLGWLMIVVWVTRVLASRIADAVGSIAPLLQPESWDDFHFALRTTALRLAIIDPCADSGGATRSAPPEQLDAVLSSLGGTSLIISSRATAHSMRALAYVAGRRRIDGLLLTGEDDTTARIRAVVARLLESPERRALEYASSSLGETLPTKLRDVVRHLFREPERFQTVHDLALHAGVTRRTLTRILRRGRLVTAKDLLRIARVAQGLVVIRESRAPAKQVAARLGYSRYDHFLADVRRVTGCTPSQFCASGPQDSLCQFLAGLSISAGDDPSANVVTPLSDDATSEESPTDQ